MLSRRTWYALLAALIAIIYVLVTIEAARCAYLLVDDYMAFAMTRIGAWPGSPPAARSAAPCAGRAKNRLRQRDHATPGEQRPHLGERIVGRSLPPRDGEQLVALVLRKRGHRADQVVKLVAAADPFLIRIDADQAGSHHS